MVRRYTLDSLESHERNSIVVQQLVGLHGCSNVIIGQRSVMRLDGSIKMGRNVENNNNDDDEGDNEACAWSERER